MHSNLPLTLGFCKIFLARDIIERFRNPKVIFLLKLPLSTSAMILSKAVQYLRGTISLFMNPVHYLQ